MAIAALYFAVLPKLDPMSVGSSQRYEIFSHSINLNSRNAHLALQNVSVLAAAISKALADNKIAVPESVRTLEKPALDETMPKNHEIDWELNDGKISAAARKIERANEEILSVRSKLQKQQAIAVFVGTLQWGFGDLVGKC